jgi:hypothetical protein
MRSLVLAVSLMLPQVAQTPPPPKPPVAGTAATAQSPAPEQGPYEFVDDMGAFVIVVKAEKAAAFDAAMSRLRQVFAASTDKARKQQAAGWRVLKSTEKPTDGAITYFWLIDSVAKTTSYYPIDILRELSPADVQPVYEQLQSAIVSITRVGLKELLKMGGA